MANRQYVGARYVPKFATPVEWNNALSYEALTIVTHLGNSFTSKKPVPAGVDIGNTEYWVNTGNYNEQVATYQKQVATYQNQVTELSEQVADLYINSVSLKNPPAGLTPCDPTGQTDCAAAAQAIINYARNNKQAVAVDGVFKIDNTLNLSSGDTLIGVGTNTANYDVNSEGNLATILSGFVCTNKTAINISNRAFSVTLKNFAIVGSSANANPAILGDRLRDSVFENLRISWFNTGIKLTVLDAAFSDDNVMYNTFTNIRVDRCTHGVTMDGGIYGSYSGDCCHNSFVNLSLDAFDTCLVLGDTDNNTFVETYCFNRGGDWSVKFGTACRSNYFYHFQGRAITQGGRNNWIYGYDRENAQKLPYLESGSLYVITSDGAFLKQTEQGNAYILQGKTYGFGDIQPGTGTLAINSDTSAGQPLFYTIDSSGNWKGQLTIQ